MAALIQLTGDVTTPTGRGALAATIANLAVTNAKIANATIDLTAKVTGILPLANGGSNAALTAAAGGVVYSTASALALTAAGTSGFVLQSNGTSAPTWVAGATAPTSMVQVNTGNGSGATNTSVLRFTTQSVNIGSNITYADSSTLGATFTINQTGVYACFSSKKTSSAGAGFLISVNQASSLGANGASGFASTGGSSPQVIAYAEIPTTGTFFSISGTFRLSSGDVVRVLCDNNQSGDSRQIFTITQVA